MTTHIQRTNARGVAGYRRPPRASAFWLGSRRAVLCGLVMLAPLVVCGNSGTETSFDEANKLYSEGKFAEAAVAYEKTVQSGLVSPALLFNLGNAHYKAGHFGMAIAAYRRAEQLSPRDADLRANLQFVRNQVQGPKLRRGALERTLGLLSLNEWAGLGSIAFWATFGLLALRQLRPTLAGSLRAWTRLAGVTTVLLGISLALVLNHQSPGRTVVIIKPETSVRISPNDNADSAFAAHDGAEFLVLDEKDAWLQVTDGNPRRFGWIKREQVSSL